VAAVICHSMGMRFGVVLLLSLGLASCGGGGSSSNGDAAPPDPYPDCGPTGKYVLDDPTMTPMGFDSAACHEFMKAIPTIMNDVTKAPDFKTPLAGALLPATPVAKFTWTAGMLAMNGWPSIWKEIKDGLVLERTAYADDGGSDGGGDAGGSTLTSDAYVVIFRSATQNADGGLDEILRVMTINLYFTPTDAQWAALQAVGTIEASVYGMHFDNGKITTGPFVAPQARAFTVAAM
jgi:hypothetical protein